VPVAIGLLLAVMLNANVKGQNFSVV
jgi:ABC-type sugar transport system permease subunit